LPTLIEKATEKMMTHMTSEIKRLVSLKEKNPAIRDEEINHLKDSTLKIHASLQQTQIKFDALRIIICT
jgi:ATP-dependent helicase HepA